MKNYPRIFTLALGLSLSLGAQSCSTFLDQSPQGQQTTDNYYTTADECKAAVMGCYALADQDGWWKIDRTRMFGDAGSDDAWKGNAIAGDQREFGDFARFFWLPNNEWFDNRYTHIYQSIGNCNAALVGIAKAPIDPTLQQQLIGEVKFLRAYNYFELVKGYGGVPLVLTPVSPSESIARYGGRVLRPDYQRPARSRSCTTRAKRSHQRRQRSRYQGLGQRLLG
jgi:hypothetical protein